MLATRKWPVVTLVALFVLEFLTWWGLLETAAEKLRSKGPVGVFLLEALTSPIVRMALIIAAIVWVVKRPERAGEQPPLANVNLKTLASFYREHTTLEANRLLEGFKGKNIAIEGIVLDMFKTEILVGGLSVRVRSKAGIDVLLIFDSASANDVSHLQKGQPIKASGLISAANVALVTLEKAKLRG